MRRLGNTPMGSWAVSAEKRFESPAEEVRKFRRRLVSVGAVNWPRESAIVELFCGRGNGLKALASLGFQSLSGVDLSETYERWLGQPDQILQLLRTHFGPEQQHIAWGKLTFVGCPRQSATD